MSPMCRRIFIGDTIAKIIVDAPMMPKETCLEQPFDEEENGTRLGIVDISSSSQSQCNLGLRRLKREEIAERLD